MLFSKRQQLFLNKKFLFLVCNLRNPTVPNLKIKTNQHKKTNLLDPQSLKKDQILTMIFFKNKKLRLKLKSESKDLEANKEL